MNYLNTYVVKFGNIEIKFLLNLDKFNKSICELKIKNNTEFKISILDSEMINTIRELYLVRNEKLNYSEILNILDKNIDSNILI